MGGLKWCSRIHLCGKVVHGLTEYALANLLALGKADTILTMDLINATATNTVMRLVLEEILPGQPDEALGITRAILGGPDRERLDPTFQQMFSGCILLL